MLKWQSSMGKAYVSSPDVKTRFRKGAVRVNCAPGSHLTDLNAFLCLMLDIKPASPHALVIQKGQKQKERKGKLSVQMFIT